MVRLALGILIGWLVVAALSVPSFLVPETRYLAAAIGGVVGGSIASHKQGWRMLRGTVVGVLIGIVSGCVAGLVLNWGTEWTEHLENAETVVSESLLPDVVRLLERPAVLARLDPLNELANGSLAVHTGIQDLLLSGMAGLVAGLLATRRPPVVLRKLGPSDDGDAPREDHLPTSVALASEEAPDAAKPATAVEQAVSESIDTDPEEVPSESMRDDGNAKNGPVAG